MEKSIFKSKTFIVNAIIGILAILTIINPELLMVFGLDAVTQTRVLTALGALTAVLNVVLRMITTEPVTIKPNKLAIMIGLIILSGSMFADSIPFDSAKTYDRIVLAVNTGLSIIPPNPVVNVLKPFSLIFGGAITGFFIALFTRKKKK
ncbi:MAG: hypothetical protein V4547_09040 [Bacteroidota bacterium]